MIKEIRKSFDAKITTLLFLVGLADFLFYKEPIGWLVGAFSLIFLLFLLAYHGHAIKSGLQKFCVFAGIGQSLVMIYDPNPLSFALYFATVMVMVICACDFKGRNPFAWADAIGHFLLDFITKFFEDFNKFLTARRQGKKRDGVAKVLALWAVPIIFSGLFVILFSAANPLIEKWVNDFLNLDFVWSLLSVKRWIFWMLFAMAIWPFLRPRINTSAVVSKDVEVVDTILDSTLINKNSVLRSLILFNAIFLLQTAMDVFYLWGGVSLPDNITYAEYAHRGAYPLIATAILAAIFTLVALRTQAQSKEWGVVKILILVFVLQNIFLVISSILRLDLYVAEYSLTVLRFSAFVWMGLVAIGLFTIIIRVVAQKDSAWLINVNLLIAYLTLYICSALNIGGFIADYNVKHSYEVAGHGIGLDVSYLRWGIGKDSLPALVWFQENQKYPLLRQEPIGTFEVSLRSEVTQNVSDWHSWTVKDYILHKEITHDHQNSMP